MDTAGQTQKLVSQMASKRPFNARPPPLIEGHMSIVYGDHSAKESLPTRQASAADVVSIFSRMCIINTRKMESLHRERAEKAAIAAKENKKAEENVEDVEDVEDLQHVEDEEDEEDLQHVEDEEDEEDLQHVEDEEDEEDLQHVEDVEDENDLQYVEDVEDEEDKQYIRNIEAERTRIWVTNERKNMLERQLWKMKVIEREERAAKRAKDRAIASYNIEKQASTSNPWTQWTTPPVGS